MSHSLLYLGGVLVTCRSSLTARQSLWLCSRTMERDLCIEELLSLFLVRVQNGSIAFCLFNYRNVFLDAEWALGPFSQDAEKRLIWWKGSRTEQVSPFMHLLPIRSLSIQIVKHLHPPGICAETSFSPWKHSGKCLKDGRNLPSVYFRSVFYSEGSSG